MAYTPPDGDAANFTWVGADAYTAPSGDAANLAFAPDVPQATLLGIGLLGAPQGVGFVGGSALLTGVGILGAPAASAYLRPTADLLGAGLLGAPTIRADAQAVAWVQGHGLIGQPGISAVIGAATATILMPGTLGVPTALVRVNWRAWLSTPGILGEPVMVANPRALATLLVPGLLGSPRQTGYVYPATAAALPRGVTTYHCLLTGAPDGLADLVLPIASFSVRHKTGTDSSYQLAIPGVALASGIGARQNGEIVISQRVAGVSEELLRGDLGDVRVDRGAMSASISISGNSQRPLVTGATYLVEKCSYQYSTFAGENRLRIDPRAGIRPGDYVRYLDTQFEVGSVSWSVSVGAGSMSVTMEVATS